MVQLSPSSLPLISTLFPCIPTIYFPISSHFFLSTSIFLTCDTPVVQAGIPFPLTLCPYLLSSSADSRRSGGPAPAPEKKCIFQFISFVVFKRHHPSREDHTGNFRAKFQLAAIRFHRARDDFVDLASGDKAVSEKRQQEAIGRNRLEKRIIQEANSATRLRKPQEHQGEQNFSRHCPNFRVKRRYGGSLFTNK